MSSPARYEEAASTRECNLLASASRRAGRSRRTDFEAFASSYPEFITGLADLRHYRDREMTKLSGLDQSAKRDRARKLLGCPRLSLLYAYEAVRRLQQLRGATPDTLRDLASRCNPFTRSHEAVQRLLIGSGTRTRGVQNFGPLKRMHQLLVADVLAALHPPRRDQYLFHGGMPMALAAIEAAFRDGYTHAVEIDMIDFYGNVRTPGLAELLRPLPASVVENVVWDYAVRRGPDDEFVIPCDEGVPPSLTGLVGLSLGAATSPIVGERIIGSLLASAQLGAVVTYADNVLVLGRDREEVVARTKHLKECASRLEAGPVRPRAGRIATFFDPKGGVEFGKQWGQAIRHRLIWVPDADKQAEHRVADHVDSMTLDQIAEAERKVTHWRRSYPMWRTGDAWELERLAELAAARYYCAAQPEHLVRARQALVMACVARGEWRDPNEFAPDWPGRISRERRETLVATTNALLEQMAHAMRADPPKAAD